MIGNYIKLAIKTNEKSEKEYDHLIKINSHGSTTKLCNESDSLTLQLQNVQSASKHAEHIAKKSNIM